MNLRRNNRFACALVGLFLLPISAALGGEVLYNGIELPDVWPPTDIPVARNPMPVPHLDPQNIPKVVPIDVGRQLLIDDFLIEKTDLDRNFHTTTYHEVNPVITYDRPWETGAKFAAPFHGGVWFDPADQTFKTWYSCGQQRRGMGGVAYATSKDGIQWNKPVLDVARSGTNYVLYVRGMDSTSVWLDHNAKSPNERFKMLWNGRRTDGRWFAKYHTSPDGMHWSGILEERNTDNDNDLFFYNPFRKVWVYQQRVLARNPLDSSKTAVGRARLYREHSDPRTLIAQTPLRTTSIEKTGPPDGSVFWVGADDLDPRNPDERFGDIPPQLYSVAAGAYESLMLGLFAIWSGPENVDMEKYGGQKRNDVLVGFSRDGFHWDRSCRKRFIPCTWKKGDWNYANVQPVTNCCLIVGDKLYFYVSGRAWGGSRVSTGLATLRRDGFASMDAGDTSGTLTTRPVTFKGKHLFVNVDCPQGELKAEVLDRDGRGIEPFTLANCKPVSCDKTLTGVTWKGAADLSTVAGKPVRFRFHLNGGSLYSFWVSPDMSGASQGFVGSGGPGFTGTADTEGIKAYKRLK